MKTQYVFFYLICVMSTGVCNGQKPQYGKYTITTQPLQFLCREIPITVERIFKRQTLGVTLGYRFDSPLDQNPNGLVEYATGSYPGFSFPLNKALTFGINSKYYLTKESRIYLEAHLFYRYWWYNNRFHADRYDGDPPDDEYLTSARHHVIGTKFLFGISSNPIKKRKVQALLNTYFGIGCRIKLMHEYGETRLDPDYGSPGPYTPFNERARHILPTIHLGINLGIEVFSKNKTVE